jgi:hypothetical protein
VLLQVGQKGQTGTAELQDLIITTKGPTAGAILIEWNMRAEGPGMAAMWDVHVRIGGATGTDLTPDECPAVTSGVNANCNAASLMMHITPLASGYFENIWLWLSDHDIEHVFFFSSRWLVYTVLPGLLTRSALATLILPTPETTWSRTRFTLPVASLLRAHTLHGMSSIYLVLHL